MLKLHDEHGKLFYVNPLHVVVVAVADGGGSEIELTTDRESFRTVKETPTQILAAMGEADDFPSKDF